MTKDMKNVNATNHDYWDDHIHNRTIRDNDGNDPSIEQSSNKTKHIDKNATKNKRNTTNEDWKKHNTNKDGACHPLPHNLSCNF